LHDGNGTSGHPAAQIAVDSELATRLHALGRSVSPIEISELWVFPPLPDIEDSGEFVLFTRVLADEMRRVCAVEFGNGVAGNGAPRANGNGVAGNGNGNGGGSGDRNGNGNGHGAGNGNGAGISGPTVRIIEYGRVPSNRVQRVVDGFRRRLGDDREPLHLRVEGCPHSWVRMLDCEPSEG
jgi:hypothetical protein